VGQIVVPCARCSEQNGLCPTVAAPVDTCASGTFGNCGAQECFGCSVGPPQTYLLCVEHKNNKCQYTANNTPCGFIKDAGCAWTPGVGCGCLGFPATYNGDPCKRSDCTELGQDYTVVSTEALRQNEG
jgi:hypothetical protein